MYLKEFLWKVLSILNPFLGFFVMSFAPMLPVLSNPLANLLFFEKIIGLPIWMICLLVLFVIVTVILFVNIIRLTFPIISKDRYGIKIDFIDFNDLYDEERYIVVSGWISILFLGLTIFLFFIL